MPYRRLPNTDKARLTAMKQALSQQEKEVKMILPYRFRLELNEVAINFENKLVRKNFTKKKSTQQNRQHSNTTNKSRMYVSHFLQIINMSIQRGELPKKTLSYYGIENSTNRLPNLISEKELLHWGTQIIQGEQKRIQTGVNRISNPSIALVSINFEKFKESLSSIELQRSLLTKAIADITGYREIADKYILELWNIIEEKFNPKTEKGREMCSLWGVKYIYRKGEKRQKISTKELHAQEVFTHSISLV